METAVRTEAVPRRGGRPRPRHLLEKRLERALSLILHQARQANLRHFRFSPRPEALPRTDDAYQRLLARLEQDLQTPAPASRHCETTVLERLQGLALLSQPPRDMPPQRRRRVRALVWAALESIR